MSDLLPFAVELAPHDPRWAERARSEARRLAAALGPCLVAVHHIGSTAIAGIDAKPIVDLMPVVRSLVDFDRATHAVEALGYRVWGEYGIDGRRYCTVNDPRSSRREVQAHVFAEGSAHIARHLAFRDYMNAHPPQARAYHDEKHRCRVLYPNDSHGYADAKSEWVRAAEQRALAWAAQTSHGGATA